MRHSKTFWAVCAFAVALSAGAASFGLAQGGLAERNQASVIHSTAEQTEISVRLFGNVEPAYAGTNHISNGRVIVLRASPRICSRIAAGDEARVRVDGGPARIGRVISVAAGTEGDASRRRVVVTLPGGAGADDVWAPADAVVPLGTVAAHELDPSLVTTDDQGRIGVAVLDARGNSDFVLVSVVGHSAEGLLVTGLPDRVRLAVTGRAGRA